MLLSIKHQYLFVHIAKTGGTSIRQALKKRSRGDPYRLAQQACSRLSALAKHRIGVKFPRHAKVIAAMEMLPKDVFEGLFTFSIVRNPWDLQVSSYHHVRRERPHLIAHVPDFDSFIEWKFSDRRTYHYILDTSTAPQRSSLVDLDGNLAVDYIGRFETLSRDFRHICERIGFTPPFSLPHKRKARVRKDYRFYYSDRSAQFIAERFRPDIEAFGYGFDPPREEEGRKSG
jgi:hypothetical protein